MRAGDLRLQTDLTKDVLFKVLQRLFRDARSSIEEQGFNTLFLALGMLEFTVPGDREPWRAPLLLHPAQLLRRGARADFSLAAYEDDSKTNLNQHATKKKKKKKNHQLLMSTCSSSSATCI